MLKRRLFMLVLAALLVSTVTSCLADIEEDTVVEQEDQEKTVCYEVEDIFLGHVDGINATELSLIDVSGAVANDEPEEELPEEMPEQEPSVAVEGIALPKSITLGVGEKRALVPVLTPAEANESISFSSSKKTYVTVSEDGLLTAKKVGSARITARSEGGKKATVDVKVVKKPKKLRLNRTSACLAIGAELKLKPVFPMNAGGGVTYTSSDPSVAVVDSVGLVTGVGRGTASITAQTYNGKKAICEVSVFFDVTTLMTKRASDRLEVLFFDVERNDSILLHCGGEYALVDAGRRSEGKLVSRFLKAHGIKHLKYYIGTHAHEDHVGGAPVILAGVKVDKVIVPHKGVISYIKSWARTAKEKKAVKKARYIVMFPGKSLSLGGTKLRCLGPIEYRKVKRYGEENANSLILQVSYGNRTLLLPGDATYEELDQVYGKSAGSLRVDVLKNPHHHLSLGEGYEWFGMKYVVVSTGSKYPLKKDFVTRVRKLGAKMYVTASNKNGDVLMITDGEDIKFYTNH